MEITSDILALLVTILIAIPAGICCGIFIKRINDRPDELKRIETKVAWYEEIRRFCEFRIGKSCYCERLAEQLNLLPVPRGGEHVPCVRRTCPKVIKLEERKLNLPDEGTCENIW